MDFQLYLDQVMALGADYGVNPIIFAAIYVGAIPFFTASIGWLVRNLRRGKAPTFPILSAGFFFISAYLYLLIAGQNIPLWVYGLIGIMVAYGAYSTFKKVRKQTAAPDGV